MQMQSLVDENNIVTYHRDAYNFTYSQTNYLDKGHVIDFGQPTVFEAELPDLGIELVNSRPYHPQTNGKLERFHGGMEDGTPYTMAGYLHMWNGTTRKDCTGHLTWTTIRPPQKGIF